MNRASGANEGTDTSRLRDLKQNSGDQNSGRRRRREGSTTLSNRNVRGKTLGAGRRPAKFFPERRQTLVGEILGTGASNISADTSGACPLAMATAEPITAARRRAPSFAALPGAHVSIRSSIVSVCLGQGQRVEGPARGIRGSL